MTLARRATFLRASLSITSRVASRRRLLRECFRNARRLGISDLDELAATRARVEWRPSLAMVDEVIDEFS
jgi:hypothetical protein